MSFPCRRLIALGTLLLAGLVGPVQASPPAAAESLTLDQCVDIAVNGATAVLQSLNQYGLTGTQVLQGYGQFLPNLSVGASYGYETGSVLYTIEGQLVAYQRGQTASLNVSSSLNLFNGVADYAGLKAALAQRNAAGLSLEWAKVQVALDMTQTFLQWALDSQLVEIGQNNLEASRVRLKLIQGQTEVGASSIPDLYRQQAQTSADAYTLATQQARVKVDEILLIRKLRVDPGKNYRFTQPPLEPVHSALAARPVEDLIRGAVSERPDVRSGSESVESADWGITRARAGYLPRLDLVFGRDASGVYLSQDLINGADALSFTQPNLGAQLGNQVQYTVSLNLSWNLFDRFTTPLNVQQARTLHENARIALDDARYQAAADVRSAHVQYGTALQQVEDARVGLQAAQKSYEAVEGLYKVGGASIVDVLTAQAALVQARSNSAQSLLNLRLQDRVLRYAVGRLTEPR